MDIKNIMAEFQLLGTAIICMEVHNNFVHIDNFSELEKSMDVEYEVVDTMMDDNMRFGKIRIYVNLNMKKAEEEMKINLILEGGFGADPEMSEETFYDLISLNGCASLYSIARSIIMSISSQTCSGGQVILPMINVFKLKEEKEDKR